MAKITFERDGQHVYTVSLFMNLYISYKGKNFTIVISIDLIDGFYEPSTPGPGFRNVNNIVRVIHRKLNK